MNAYVHKNKATSRRLSQNRDVRANIATFSRVLFETL